ncbi:MAG: AAA family ATPase [Ottowia sp.]
MQTEIERARAALACIPADLPREQWARVGMAVKAAGLTFEDFDAWSQQGASYRTADARDTWRSIKADGGVTAATLHYIAREHGYSDSMKPRQGLKSAAGALPKREHTQAPAMSPAAVWGRCEPATWEHAYIARKGAAGVPLAALRVVPEGDALRIAGQSVVGWLVVPARGADGELQSLQFVPPGAGKKLNLPGASMAGARHIVGEPQEGRPLYLVEGIGQAWACWQATGRRAVVCFGWGNVGRVAAQLREREPTAALVLVPDTGKEADADKLARELQCAVAKLPEGEPANFDANDYARREGGDALAALLEGATEPPKPEPLLKPVDVAGVIANPSPPPRFVWEGYCPRGEVTLLGAHGGTGKSTIGEMLAVAVVTGRPLFGVPTERAAVVFASLEDGAHVVRHRLAHICRQWQIEPAELTGLHIVDGTESPELFTAEGRSEGRTTAAYAELRALVNATGAGLAIVDNASDAYGGDEIQRRSVRAFVRSLAAIARDVDAACLLLAHVNKGTSRAGKAEGGEGYSGSTAWHNSVRSRLFMSRAADGSLLLEHQKANLGRKREPLTLHWPDGGLPDSADAPATRVLVQRAQARADDTAAAALLRLLAEFEGRGQYASPNLAARNNPHALLRSEPAFKALGLTRGDVQRLVNQCQRAGWIEVADYRTSDRKERERWAVTEQGRIFAGLTAPTAPTAPTSDVSAEGAKAQGGCAHRAHPLGGYGG